MTGAIPASATEYLADCLEYPCANAAMQIQYNITRIEEWCQSKVRNLQQANLHLHHRD